MATYNARPTNGVSYALQYTVVAADETAGEITFDFQVEYDLAAAITVRDASGVNVPLADAVITYPAAGQVKIEDGAATFALAADQVIDIVAQRAVTPVAAS